MNFLSRIITADNTESFLNTKVGESYHSQTGAVEEALKKYAIPCKIREKAKTGTLTILDMFFGLGYNSAMAISEALAENPSCEINVVGLELDREILAKIQEVTPPIPFFIHYKKLTPESLSLQEGRVTVSVLLGDARETIKNLPDNNFDAVFFDPFSPKTSPEMWGAELFKEVCRVLKHDGLMSTYSCARLARENMAAAGLVYDDGPTVGRRGPGTVAIKWT